MAGRGIFLGSKHIVPLEAAAAARDCMDCTILVPKVGLQWLRVSWVTVGVFHWFQVWQLSWLVCRLSTGPSEKHYDINPAKLLSWLSILFLTEKRLGGVQVNFLIGISSLLQYASVAVMQTCLGHVFLFPVIPYLTNAYILHHCCQAHFWKLLIHYVCCPTLFWWLHSSQSPITQVTRAKPNRCKISI